MDFKDKFIKEYSQYFSWDLLKVSKGNKALNLKVSRENLLILKDVFDEYGLKFWLIFGTALGAYRDKNFIVYDRDTDIAIFNNDINKLFAITDALIERGLCPLRIFTEDWPYPTGSSNGISYYREGEYIDICFFKKITGRYWCADHWAELHQFDNLDTIKFLDKDFNIPSDIENYLVDRYGDDWNIPIMGKRAIN